MQRYFALRTRAVRPRWLLEELGIPYELVKMDAADQKSAAYSRVDANAGFGTREYTQ